MHWARSPASSTLPCCHGSGLQRAAGSSGGSAQSSRGAWLPSLRCQLLVHRLPHVRPYMCDRNQTHVGSISNAGRCCASTPSSPTCALRCALRCGRRAFRCASRGAGGLQRSSPLLMDAVPGCDFVVLRFVGSAVARRELDAPKLPRQLPTLACPNPSPTWKSHTAGGG